MDIKAASLDTKLKKRDKDLRAPEFFDVDKYPDISVVVTSAEAIGGDTVDLRANLTRKDFGVDGNMMGMIRDAATLTADVVFRRAGS